MSFTTVNADNMLNTVVSYGFLRMLVDIIPSGCLKVEGYRHMKLELVNRITTVLYDVVIENAAFLGILCILVRNGRVCLMCRGLVKVETLLTIEYFCLAIQFIYYIS